MFERFDPDTEVEIGYPKSTRGRFWRLDKVRRR
jgi:hypothetical protein